MQLEGMFDMQPSLLSTVEWDMDVPLSNREWSIGLIVGPSGCGKSTIAKELFSADLIYGYEWSPKKSIVDDFPDRCGIKEITHSLSSVGFSSPPNWLRPFHVLSNGEQFRVTMARALCESKSLIVVDEFTSVIDRTVAKIGSAAISKAVRNTSKQFVAVGCHYDVVEWLDPDWILEPLTGRFQWRLERQRPKIILSVRRVHHSAWKAFKGYHYLSADLNKAAVCFVAFIENDPAAFCAVLSMPHQNGGMWREHRTVCRPDYQGVGIGNALSEFVASVFAATEKKFVSTTSSPAMMRHRDASSKWERTRKHGFNSKHQGAVGLSRSGSHLRMTSSYKYIGESRIDDAIVFEVLRPNKFE